jgi:hypothetical protein
MVIHRPNRLPIIGNRSECLVSPHHRQKGSCFFFLRFILPKNRDDAKGFRFLNQASQVMAQGSAPFFGDHRPVIRWNALGGSGENARIHDMAASTLSQRIFRGVSRLADEALSFLPTDSVRQDDSGSLRDAIEGLKTCIRLHDYLRDSVNLALDEAFDGHIDEYNTTGLIFRAAFTASIILFDKVKETVEDIDSKDAPMALRRSFESVAQNYQDAAVSIRQLQIQFEKNWPWVDENLLAQSIGGVGVERRRPAKVAFDEIRSRHQRQGNLQD